ncbi:MAG TPA: allene oxide cyclase family protein [Actinomycetota bacterium]|jgi:hypothetical protein
MRKVLSVGAIVSAFVLLVGLAASALDQGVVAPTRVHVIEHAVTDTVIDTDASGTDTTGDLLTFANAVFNGKDTAQVGHDQGDCIRIDPAQGTWECRWITWVGSDALTVEGPFYDAQDSVLAITGGTGMFKNARGSMLLKSRAGGTEFDFIFSIVP